jgi:hypothetical protein
MRVRGGITLSIEEFVRRHVRTIDGGIARLVVTFDAQVS